MTTYEAPAKLNLSLLVFPPRPDGYHPLESLVQTVEWCDLLHVDRGQHGSDTLQSDIEDNLVERALRELRKVVCARARGTIPLRDAVRRTGAKIHGPLQPTLAAASVRGSAVDAASTLFNKSVTTASVPRPSRRAL